MYQFMLHTEKNIAKINDTLWASKYEVTNSEYITFLDDLNSKKDFSAIKIAAIDTANWMKYSEYNKPYSTFYHNHPAYKDYPVVNISYDGAVLFCNWMSSTYNQHPKRKFNKVIFRLPTEAEWLLIARGNEKNNIYPWKGNLLTDQKGHFFCNFRHISDEHVHFDKKYEKYEIKKINSDYKSSEWYADNKLPGVVGSYFPNVFGLYNLSGNVAEMIAERHKAKGGSWLDTGYDVRLDQFKIYTDNDIDIGFRYIMVILEK